MNEGAENRNQAGGNGGKPQQHIRTAVPLSSVPEKDFSKAQPEHNPRTLLLRWRKRGWFRNLLLGMATFAAYWPCLRGELLWDDDAWTLKLEPLFHSLSGLARIWTNVTVLQQYYP